MVMWTTRMGLASSIQLLDQATRSKNVAASLPHTRTIQDSKSTIDASNYCNKAHVPAYWSPSLGPATCSWQLSAWQIQNQDVDSQVTSGPNLVLLSNRIVAELDISHPMFNQDSRHFLDHY